MKRNPPAVTDLRRRRLALRLTAAEVATAAGFSESKLLRVELDPARARVRDVLTLTEALRLLEVVANAPAGRADNATATGAP